MPQILIELPGGPVVTHEIEHRVTTIGRLPDNAIQIDDPSVSSRHAEIEILGGESVTLKDLDSTNGTTCNGEPITRIQLSYGDAIRFGKVHATFQTDERTGETKPLPETESVTAAIAETSARPPGFSNASPFEVKSKDKKDLTLLLMGLAGLGIAALAVALLQVHGLQPPQ